MLPRQVKEIQFDSGLNTKGDRRAQPEQLLDIGTNVEFDDVGGLRVRFPFDSARTALVGGGTLSNPRKLATLDDELVCFTDSELYSWVPSESAWQLRGDHLAVATDEQTVFAAPGDQFACDRAEVNGQIVYCWQDATGSIFVAARDKTSGAVTQPPTQIPGSGIVQHPRLVALSNSVLLFWVTTVLSSSLNVANITVGPYTFTASSSSVATYNASAIASYFDVCLVPGQDRCLAVAAYTGSGTQNYTIASVDATFAGTTTTGTMVSADAQPIAIAVSPDALFATVVNMASAEVLADVWNVTAAGTPLTNLIFQTRLDAFITGTPSHVTAGYRLTQDSAQFRCYVFWTFDESDTVASDIVFPSCVNWIDASGANGGRTSAPAFVYGLGIGSRAFAHDSHTYVWGSFAGLSFAGSDPTGTHSELQNTYYLYRDDGFLVAKAVWGEGGGFHPTGWLPNVVADVSDVDSFSLMEGIRRIVPVGANATLPVTGASIYAERAPREVTITFDDDRARRCVQFGSTLYVMGGILLGYDGAQLAEIGTCTYPWELDVSTGSTGVIPAGGYSYKATLRWSNAKGELDRSTTATVANFTAPGTTTIEAQLPNLFVTRKAGVAIEVWRTQVAPAPGAPFFLVTSQDPAVATGNNRYVASDPTVPSEAILVDNLADAEIAVLPANPENGAVLSNIEPPPASIVYADGQRMYLAGVPGYPNTVYYSKYRQPGLVAAFNDALTFDTPSDGGAITAIDALDGTLIVWCATATYAYAGVGFDDTGGGSNFQLSRILSSDLGAEGHETRDLYEDGFLVKTGKGWFLLDRSLTYHYVGGGPFAFDAEPVLAMIVLTARHQVRALTANRLLVFDTLVSQWAQSTIADGLDLVLWNEQPAYLNASGARAELSTWDGYGATDASLVLADVEPSWVKFGSGLQSRAIVDFVQLLGEFRSDCVIRKRIAKDYEAVTPGVWNYHTDETWTPSPGTVGSALQVRQSPRWKRCEALKTRFTITAPDGVSPLGGPCARLTGIAIPFALEPGAYGALSSAQKQ